MDPFCLRDRSLEACPTVAVSAQQPITVGAVGCTCSADHQTNESTGDCKSLLVLRGFGGSEQVVPASAVQLRGGVVGIETRTRG